MGNGDARPGFGTPQARTDREDTCTTHACPDEKTRTARPLPEPLARERKLVARDYDDALDDLAIANTSLAEGYFHATESLVRRLRTGEKPLGLFHLTNGPRDVFARVLVRAVVRAYGRIGAMDFFAACIGDIGRGDR